MFCCSSWLLLSRWGHELSVRSFEFVTLQTQSYDSHQETNWSEKQTNQPKKPAQTSSLLRHKQPTSKSQRVLFHQRETLVLMWKRHLFAARKPCHSLKANCARTCTNTVNSVSWGTRLESFMHVKKNLYLVVLLLRKSQMQFSQAPYEGFVFQSN